MLLDERSFENQGLDFVVGDDEFNVSDLFDQLNSLDVIAESYWAAGLKVLAHAAAQALGFADIDDASGCVLVQVHAGRGWDFFELLFQFH